MRIPRKIIKCNLVFLNWHGSATEIIGRNSTARKLYRMTVQTAMAREREGERDMKNGNDYFATDLCVNAIYFCFFSVAKLMTSRIRGG